MSSTMDYNYKYETLRVSTPNEFVYHVELNRPDESNAMNDAFWRETRECFTTISQDENCRVVVLSGAGKLFSAGIDFKNMTEFISVYSSEQDIARKARFMHDYIKDLQSSFTAIEKCGKPVIAAVHTACIGAGVDMIAACDIRYCTQDAWFQIKEVEFGLAADVGTLQRLPKIVGNDGFVRELAYTARKCFADEALQFGIVSRVLPSKEEMMLAAMETAVLIASKRPVAVQGSKLHLNYSRDHTVDEGLDYGGSFNPNFLRNLV